MGGMPSSQNRNGAHARVARLIAACLAGALSTFASPVRAEAPRTIVFFGDSLTAGYGLDDPGAEAYPAIIGKKILAAHLPWRVVNAGLSGETTAGGLRRVDWVLRQPAAVFVLALGANDGLRGVPTAETHANLTAIVARVRAKRPEVLIVIAGMQMPSTMGPDYTRDFAAVFPAVARETGAILLPFLLEGVGGHPEFNQADGIHPSAAGHAILAETVWRVLRPLLEPR